jgi:CPA2 family monovalent cation:H+ antiporter-2
LELHLLNDIILIFAVSIAVNLLFNRIKVPTIVGYLLTGMLIGPHLLSLVTEEHEIEVLAEIGVAMLLFTIGMEFSLKHLIKIRRVVFFGGLLQVSITALVFYLVSGIYGLDWKAALFIGFLAALSSSALVLKLLQERSELTSNYGRTVLGILIFQDILLVPLLLFSNLLTDETANLTREIGILGLKTLMLLALVYAGNRWLLPRLLHQIAITKNQELFLMSVLFICFSIALLTFHMGMSLAFGAFLAGLIISESRYSHTAFSNFLPFRDIFTSFFFVSIGMLLNLSFVIDNIIIVVSTVAMLLVIKSIIAGGVGFVLGHTFRGTVLIGLALSQVGEFSFILAKLGLQNGIISDFYFQLFLSVAVITMALTPLLMKGSKKIANTLLKLPLPKVIVDGMFPLKEMKIPSMSGHVVIIGKDEMAVHLAKLMKEARKQVVSIIFDPQMVNSLMNQGYKVIYGDAVNIPILEKAHIENASTIVVSVGDTIPAMSIIEKSRNLNGKAKIIVRAPFADNVELLHESGADIVIPEKVELATYIFQSLNEENQHEPDELLKLYSLNSSMDGNS